MSVILPLPPREVHSPFRSRPTTPVSGTVSPLPHSPSPSSPSLAAQAAQRMSRPCTPPPHAGAHNSSPPGSSHGAGHAGASSGAGGGHSVAAAAILGTPQLPISAPPTPVTPTHTFGAESSPMERCRSSEAGCGVTMSTSKAGSRSASRERRREPTASSLLLHTYPSRSSTPSPSTPSALGPGRDKDVEVGDVGSHLQLPDAVAAPPSPAREPVYDDHSMDIDMEIEEAKVDGDGDVDMETTPAAQGEIAPVPTEEEVRHKQEMQEEQAPQVWGLSRRGMDGEEIRPHIRLLDMERLPEVIREHDMLDVPSHVLFPWMHGISDDGKKGRDMAAFFGRQPPFEPPAYRGLTLILAPDHPLNDSPFQTAEELAAASLAKDQATNNSTPQDTNEPKRERSETMSTSSGSYASYASRMSVETAATSPSVADYRPPSAQSPKDKDITEEDVQMHPCEAKKTGTSAPTITTEQWKMGQDETADSDDDESLRELEEGEERAACLIQNASYCMEVFDLPDPTTPSEPSYFRNIRLPNQINLRNLNIQPIKYATISDVVMYAKGGISAGVVRIAEMMVEAQNRVYEERMAQWYADAHVRGVTGQGEGVDRPVRYGVWIVREPFEKIEKFAPHIVQLDSIGRRPRPGKAYAIFKREVYEAAAMTRASEVCPNFWVGNDMDVPGSEGDGAWWSHRFHLCVMASELNDMPQDYEFPKCARKLAEIRTTMQAKDAEQLKAEQEKEREGASSPATIALRNILSPTTGSMGDKEKEKSAKSGQSIIAEGTSGAKRGPSDSRDELAHIPASKNPRSGGKGASRAELAAAKYPYYTLRCAGSSRNMFGQMRNQNQMVNQLHSLVAFINAVAEGRDPVTGNSMTVGSDPDVSKALKVLVHCHDGYTESTILVLAYIMYTLDLTLPEAFLHLQVKSKRSFFLYPVDKPLLKRLDLMLQQDRRVARMRRAAAAAEKERAAATKGAGGATPTQTQERNSASPASPSSSGTSRWKSWGFRSSSSNSDKNKEGDDRSDRRSRKESSSSLASTSSASSAAAVAESGQSTPTASGGNRRWSRESRGRDAKSKVSTPGNELDAKQEDAARSEQGVKEQEGTNRPVEEELPQHVLDMKEWFGDRRFEGFPSRILPFLYLGNIEHAGNAAMLKAIGITHVVSVGESLLTSQPDHDPMYGLIGSNTLGNEAKKGNIQVLDLTDIRDDGNDPLRPLIARACKWIEEARKEGGVVLVHCRVGVSRSASIVIAYMMQHQKLGLMDAYLTCRARRLNVLIQPNLRFFHELFGWEVELAREEENIIKQRRQEMEATGMVDEVALQQMEQGKRRIVYAWPTFCRDLHILNRRFLCN